MSSPPAQLSVLLIGLLQAPCLLAKDYVPVDLTDAGMDWIVADTVTFPSPNGTTANLDNWECYTSVLGGHTFLIQCNKFAEEPDGGSPQHMSHGIVFQRVDGSEPARQQCFWTDEAEPYALPINFSRQEGNPGRIAGDRRPGADIFMVGGETSIHKIQEFQSNDRWNQGAFVRPDDERFATVQIHRWDPLDLIWTPQTLAFDPIYGNYREAAVLSDELSRFGADIVCLDNGNFAVVVEDRSGILDPLRCVTVAIFDPMGEVVREPFVLASPARIWSNVAAYEDGFCVRAVSELHFLDNVGDIVGRMDPNQPGLRNPAHLMQVQFLLSDRGDDTRIAGHVNSPYVFMAGPVWAADEEGYVITEEFNVLGDVWLAAYDSRDLSFVASTPVNELTEELGGFDTEAFRMGVDRVNLAVDALNRVCVTWEVFFETGVDRLQVVARVFEFDDEALTFRALTPTFFPFLNYSPPPNGTVIQTFRPSVTMTTEAICVSAKGDINLANDPSAGVNSLAETNFYSVFTHPDPQEDRTLAVAVGPFVRGNTNNDSSQDLSDAVFTFNYLFVGEREPSCLAAADVNGDGTVDISDGIYLLNYLFLGGPAPASPYPNHGFSAHEGSLDLGCKTPSWP